VLQIDELGDEVEQVSVFSAERHSID